MSTEQTQLAHNAVVAVVEFYQDALERLTRDNEQLKTVLQQQSDFMKKAVKEQIAVSDSEPAEPEPPAEKNGRLAAVAWLRALVVNDGRRPGNVHGAAQWAGFTFTWGGEEFECRIRSRGRRSTDQTG